MPMWVNPPPLPIPETDGLILKSVNGSPTWVIPSQAFTQVTLFTDLPDASLSNGEIYYVRESSGVWLINRKSRGFYRSNGIEWEYAGELIEAFNSANFRVYKGSGEVFIDPDASSSITIFTPAHNVDLSEIRQGHILLNIACQSDVLVGHVVAYNTTGTLKRAIATENITVLGVCEAKPTTTTAHIRISGITEPYLSALTQGASYFLSETSAGEIQISPPATDGAVVYFIGEAVDANRLAITPQSVVIRSTS